MDRHRPELQRFIIHPKLVATESLDLEQYIGSFLITPRPPTLPRTYPNRPPRPHIHNGERVSWRDEDRVDMEANHSSWAPFIGLLVVVVFCAAAWVLAPKGENQTYVHPSLLYYANPPPHLHALPFSRHVSNMICVRSTCLDDVVEAGEQGTTMRSNIRHLAPPVHMNHIVEDRAMSRREPR
jgi:V-type H+-transporting ATPase subunit e